MKGEKRTTNKRKLRVENVFKYSAQEFRTEVEKIKKVGRNHEDYEETEIRLSQGNFVGYC